LFDFFIFIDSYVTLIGFICKFDAEVTLGIKSNFLKIEDISSVHIQQKGFGIIKCYDMSNEL